MSFSLLIKKLYLNNEKFIVSDLIKGYCNKLELNYYNTIRYLTHNKYLIRIFKGIFYMPSIEERKLNKLNTNYLDTIAEALKIKGVKNWYFGLETSLKLNNLTHEFFLIDYVINDKIFRAKPITILNYKIKFIKIKKELLSFGIKKKKLPFSNVEKTVLDIIYLAKYESISDNEIKSKIIDLLKHCSKVKLLNYSKKYNNSVTKFIEGVL